MTNAPDISIVYQTYRTETPAKDYWDYAALYDLFGGHMWRPARWPQFNETSMPTAGGAIVVLPSRHHASGHYADQLNRDISKLDWAILMLIGDEESVFPLELVKHPNLRTWRMMARPDDPNVDTRLPNFYAPHVHLLDDMPVPRKTYDWAFMGQVTHSRREACAAALRDLPGGILVESQGFTQGVSPDEYVLAMASAKVAPCPSGPQAPDSFRFAEALELGCLPIVDVTAPVPYPDGYWEATLGTDHPIPVIHDWSRLPRAIDELLADWPHNANRIGSWWMQYKRPLAYALLSQIEQLSGESAPARYLDDQLTVLVYCGPNTRTCEVEQTRLTVRKQFPLAEILLILDDNCFAEDIRDIIWRCQRWKSWRNILPIVCQHRNQARAIRAALDGTPHVDTPMTILLDAGGTVGDSDWPAIFRDCIGGNPPVYTQLFLNLYIGNTEHLRKQLRDHYSEKGELKQETE